MTNRTNVPNIIDVLLNAGKEEKKKMSERMISVEEAKEALKCMRLGGLSEEEALETLDEAAERVRKVTMSKLVERIIEEKLSDVQRECIKKYWYEQKNTAQIARENGVSQANVYRTIERANEIIKELMTPVVMYVQDVQEAEIIPVVQESMEIVSARKSMTASFCEALRNIRVENAIQPEVLAGALKISVKELEEIESGRRVPSIVTAMRYTVIFGMEIKMTFVNGRGFYEWEKV